MLCLPALLLCCLLLCLLVCSFVSLLLCCFFRLLLCFLLVASLVWLHVCAFVSLLFFFSSFSFFRICSWFDPTQQMRVRFLSFFLCFRFRFSVCLDAVHVCAQYTAPSLAAWLACHSPTLHTVTCTYTCRSSRAPSDSFALFELPPALSLTNSCRSRCATLSHKPVQFVTLSLRVLLAVLAGRATRSQRCPALELHFLLRSV